MEWWLINKVILIGNLTKAVEIRYTQTGIAIANFTLAIKRDNGKDETDFISCIAYNKTAELVSKYLDKGSKISIEGRIQTGSYENKEGKKIYTTDVIVDKVEFLNSKKGE